MLIGWPGQQPLDDWQLLMLLVALGIAITALVFRSVRRKAGRERDENQD